MLFNFISFLISVEFDFKNGAFVALSSKCYYAWNGDKKTAKIGSKGVPRSAKLELKNFLDKLYNGSSICAEIRTLKMHKNEMIRTVQKRAALNDLFPKFHTDHDRITCSPLRCNNTFI